jgi:hypothetical protein
MYGEIGGKERVSNSQLPHLRDIFRVGFFGFGSTSICST